MTEPYVDVAPRDVHALWLLTRAFCRMPDAEIGLDEIGRLVFRAADASDVRRLLELGRTLGVVTRIGDHHVLTEDGERFKRLSHWRYWRPGRPGIFGGVFLTAEQWADDRPAIVDLFCGAGGLSLGFETAGFASVLAVDDDELACQAFRLNFPHCDVRVADVRKILETLTLKELSRVRISPDRVWGIIGGPPCQGFSEAGERNPRDERNSLLASYMSVIRRLEPDFFVLENVPGLIDMEKPLSLQSVFALWSRSVGPPAMSISVTLAGLNGNSRQADRGAWKHAVADSVREFSKGVVAVAPEEVADRVAALVESFKGILVRIVTDRGLGGYSVADVEHACVADINELALGLLMSRTCSDGNVSEAGAKCILLTLKRCNYEPLRQAACRLLLEHGQLSDSQLHQGLPIGRVFASALNVVDDRYSISEPMVLDAVDYGAPQRRRRLFLVGIHNRHKRRFRESDLYSSSRRVSAGDALGDLPNVDGFAFLNNTDELPFRYLSCDPSEYARQMRLDIIAAGDQSLPRATWNPFIVDGSKRTHHTATVKQRYAGLTPGRWDQVSRRARLAFNEPSPTVRAGTKPERGSQTAARPIHYEFDRVTTVREGARLMGYPDWMTFHPTHWHGYRLVGNGVPPQITARIAMQLKALLAD